MRDDEKLVTIAHFDNSFDAELAKLALDNAEIPCHLAGIGLSVNMPYPSVVTVEMQVFESDMERAMELLEQRDAVEEPEEGDE
jgi:hypothetical protein